jgi:putative two-component system response regulator
VADELMENEMIDKATILIVDDFPGNIDILCQALSPYYNCRAAVNGNDALALLRRTSFVPDLILLDVMMPNMDGYEVCQLLKQDNRLKDIPVIFVSAAAEIQSKLQALKLGGVDYITKPFNFKEIQARIDIHLKFHWLNQKMIQANNHLEALVEEKVQNISESRMEVIFALTKLFSQRHHRLSGHIERVQKISRQIAIQLQQDPTYANRVGDSFIEQIFIASTLYDIGKVSIPDRILQQSGELSDAENQLMMKHTLIGAQTLQDVQIKYPGNRLIDMGVDIARSHHEKWDGSGYPDGLSGEQIPLSAQILALADRLDCLYDENCCHRKMTWTDIRQTVEAEAKVSFSPNLVQAYQAISAEIESLFKAECRS